MARYENNIGLFQNTNDYDMYALFVDIFSYLAKFLWTVRYDSGVSHKFLQQVSFYIKS